MRVIKYYFLLSLLGLLPTLSFSQNETASIFDWLSEAELPEIILETDYETLVAEKGLRDYRDATVSLKRTKKETPVVEPVQVKTRGRFRNISCQNPPLKMKFKKKVVQAAGFSVYNEWKVVVPCAKDLKFNLYLFREHLIYKIYNELSEHSLRVQLAKIKFQQSGKKRPGMPLFSFVIEDLEELAGRNQLERVPDSLLLSPTDFDEGAYTKFQLFQFMIGNTDWLPVTQHNMLALRQEDGKIIPVPYDFDFTGFVNAHYAVPNSKVGVANVRERFFMGNDKTMELLNSQFEIFQDKKTAIYDLIMNYKWLAKEDKKDLVKFLDSFYEILDSEDLIKEHFLRTESFRAGQF